MAPVLIVIITFGLIFVVSASLANGLSITVQSVVGPMKGHTQLNVMLLISNFIVLPALVIGLTAIIGQDAQVKMALAVLGMTAGAPFIPWLVSLAKGNLGYSVGAVILLTLATFVVLPLLLPWVLSVLGTGATPSAWLILWPMLLFMALPLAIGMVIRARLPELAAQGAQWLGPISLTFLTVHILLFLAYTWNLVVALPAVPVLVAALGLPLAGMLVGYLLSPPYVLSPVPAANPHRGTKIVSAVAVAQQNTGAVICLAIFGLGKYTAAGDVMLIGAIMTIIVVMLTMAELGARFERSKVPSAAPQDAATRVAGQGSQLTDGLRTETGETEMSEKKPNIIFFFWDNLAWGEVGCYGGGVLRGAPTPRIDRLAAEGLRLLNFNVEAQCTPSRSAVLTGRHPIRSGTQVVPITGGAGRADPLGEDDRTAAVRRRLCDGHVGQVASRQRPGDPRPRSTSDSTKRSGARVPPTRSSGRCSRTSRRDRSTATRTPAT